MNEKLKVLKSSQQYSEYTKVGKHVDENETFNIYKREDKRFGIIYNFVQKEVELPMVYIYNISKGNLSRGIGNKWARQEINSTSFAFHKNKPNKMAIPNNLKLALDNAFKHISNYKPRTRKLDY